MESLIALIGLGLTAYELVMQRQERGHVLAAQAGTATDGSPNHTLTHQRHPRELPALIGIVIATLVVPASCIIGIAWGLYVITTGRTRDGAVLASLSAGVGVVAWLIWYSMSISLVY